MHLVKRLCKKTAALWDDCHMQNGYGISANRSRFTSYMVCSPSRYSTTSCLLYTSDAADEL